jgi:hypothetical protein
MGFPSSATIWENETIVRRCQDVVCHRYFPEGVKLSVLVSTENHSFCKCVEFANQVWV